MEAQTALRASFFFAPRPRIFEEMSSFAPGADSKTSSQTALSANHLQAIRAIRIRFRRRRHARAHISQIFFHRRFRAFREPRRSRLRAARMLCGGLMIRSNANDRIAKPLIESLFRAFIKYCAISRARCEGKRARLRIAESARTTGSVKRVAYTLR